MVTKSGSTPEPNNALALTRRALAAHATDAPEHLVAVTVQGSALFERATAEGWRAIFPLWPWVGGRFSVTSAVGLLPAELAGLDTQPLLAGAAAMDDWTRTRDWRDNPAALLAGCWHIAGDGRGDRAMVVLPYADRLVTLSRYLQQLVMESLGKDRDRQGREVHQGLTVYGNKGSTDQHAYVQQLRDGRDDFFALFLQVLATDAPDPELSDDVGAGDFLQGFLLGTRRALGERGRPSLTLTVPRVNTEVLGGLVGLFERAVGMYATLVDLNAYHQPGVEAGKRAARHLLDLSRRIRDHLARHDAATVPELAQALDAETTEVLYLCWRLHHTGRLARNGGALDGRYHLAR
jgi:glucose-6-phosphate isomerase